MYFILNNNFFDTMIAVFLIINTITILIISFSEFKKDIKNHNDDKKLTKLETFKLITNIIFIIDYFNYFCK